MTDYEHMQAIRAIAASSGRMQEHLKWLLDFHDRRTTELLAANNVLVDEKRAALRRAEEAETVAVANTENEEIIRLAHAWADAIYDLEQSRKTDEDGNKKGEGVYKANQHYTVCHLALKKYFADRRVLTSPVKKAKKKS